MPRGARVAGLRPAWLLLPALVLLLASACGGGEGGDKDGSWSARAIAFDPSAQAQPILVNSQLGVGLNRIAFGLIGRDGGLVFDATVHLRLFHLDGDTGTLAGEQDLAAVSLIEGGASSGPGPTMYVAPVRFDRAGAWGAELAMRLSGDRRETVRVRFTVLDRTAEPRIGDPAPGSIQRTLKDVSDITLIDTSTPPQPGLHDQTVAEALAKRRPLVVAFATPAFCQTRFCGPVVERVLVPLYQRYRGQAEFLHIEPFDIAEARKGRLVALPVMQQWGLSTEPWLFVIDAQGRVAAKFEGIISEQEVAAALTPLLGSR